MYSKYMAMGIAVAYEFFKLNPNYMVALGTKENFSAGFVPPSAGNMNNPVMINGEQYFWPIIAHIDGPYQQEKGNFDDAKIYQIDYLGEDKNHDDIIPITVDKDDPNFISSGVSSALSITVTRETLNALDVDYNDFMDQASDDWAEFKIVTYAYNRGINDFYSKKIFTGNRGAALNSNDLCSSYNMGGFAAHVPTVKAIVEKMNSETENIYDSEVSWSDMEVFFDSIKYFYSKGEPSDSEWSVMKSDVKRAFNLLKNKWGGEYISYRYDFLTLLRVAEKYLPQPVNPRPSGANWYYLVKNADP